MKKNLIKRKVLFLEHILLLSLIFGACMIFSCAGCQSKGEAMPKKEINEASILIYDFGDSSVPPQYHRSYKIICDTEKASLTVDSYGDILHRKTVQLKDGFWQELIEIFESANLSLRNQKKEDDGCTGGTSESIEFIQQGETVIKGWVYHCGGDDYGTLAGNLGPLKRKLQSLFDYFK